MGEPLKIERIEDMSQLSWLEHVITEASLMTRSIKLHSMLMNWMCFPLQVWGGFAPPAQNWGFWGAAPPSQKYFEKTRKWKNPKMNVIGPLRYWKRILGSGTTCWRSPPQTAHWNYLTKAGSVISATKNHTKKFFENVFENFSNFLKTFCSFHSFEKCSRNGSRRDDSFGPKSSNFELSSRFFGRLKTESSETKVHSLY